MVEFKKHRDLSKPQNLPQGRQWCIKKWKELSDLLNSQGIGESWSEEKWRKVWSDLKNNTKRKWAKANRSVYGTGGGPALKICLTDLETGVISLMGVQSATGMAIAKVGLSQVGETVQLNRIASVIPEGSNENIIIVPSEISVIDSEDWNTPGTSKDPVVISPIHRSLTPTIPTTQEHISQTKSPMLPHRESTSPPLPRHQPKKKKIKTIEQYFLRCEENARADVRERESLFVQLERERIRQRDIELCQRDNELHLQAQWLSRQYLPRE